MAYKFSKSGEITIDGFEQGIGVSPHKGIANIQNANISTESGEAMVSFARVQKTQTNYTGNITLTQYSTSQLAISGFSAFTSNMAGMWVTFSACTISGLSTSTPYYIVSMTLISGIYVIQVSTTYNGSAITGLGIGSATATFISNLGNPLSTCTEIYYNSGITYFRYYVLDSNGLVWVNDSQDSIGWRLPSTVVQGISVGASINVYNGWLIIFTGNTPRVKSTSLLGSGWNNFTNLNMVNNNAPHFSLYGHQGRLYYTDGNNIGSIFADSTLISGGTTTTVNVQTYASWTSTGPNGTLSLIGGSLPTIPGTTQRIPVVFFTAGTLPNVFNAGQIYYILASTTTPGTAFQVYANPSGGSPLPDITTGAVGTQYFNTFYPLSGGAGNGSDTILLTPQRLTLPYFETAQTMLEVSSTVMIGCASNILYPWNQIGNLPSDIITLPENNVVTMINVNNMAYIFAGNKGNIYITNGNTASAVMSVPDYTAGIPGNKKSYIEPYFVWGGAMFCRGRVFFSLLDQNANKNPGNCGGIWSFIPTQNFYFGQDVGLALRQENQASYGTYNGVSNLLIPSQNQQGIAPQYWNAWQSDVVGTNTYGIDFTGTTPGTSSTIIETELIPTGTALEKKTFSQIEYKLSSPLYTDESVTISYRQNSTDAWVSCGTAIVEGPTELAGYFPVNFEKGQWLQLQISLNPVATTNSSFVRLKEIIVR